LSSENHSTLKANSGNAQQSTSVLNKTNLMRVLVCALFALHVVVMLELVIKTGSWLTSDSPRYIALAASFAGGNGFSLATGAGFEPEGMRMPGYPLLIYVCQLLFSDMLGVVILQCLLMLISVWLIWRVALKVFGEATGLIFLALSSVYPFVSFSAGQISPEIPTVFILAAIFYLLLHRTWTRFILVGVLMALAVYFRPNLLLFGLFLTPACALADRRLVLKAVLMLVSSGLVLFPWALRNYQTFGVFTPMTVYRGTGLSLFLATWQPKVSVRSLVEYGMGRQETAELETSGMLAQVHALNEEIGVRPDTLFVTMELFPGNDKKARVDQVYTRAAISNIKAAPLLYLFGSVKNMGRMWFSAYLPESVPFIIRLGLILEGVLIFILGMTGTVLAMIRTRVDKDSRLIVFAAASTFLYFTLTLCWLHTEARYTIPARLILLMLAAYGLKRLWELRAGTV
jgi:4-amino-4-deoxy-L-arabinose transferase-like glycosyltransferase